MSARPEAGHGGTFLPIYKSMYRKDGYLETDLYKNFYHKTGFGFDINFRKFGSLIKNIFTKGWAFIVWQNDVAVIEGGNSHYAIAVFTVTKSLNPWKRFPIRRLAEVFYGLMRKN